MVMYISQTAKVKWENGLSDSFSFTNGVKQAAVLPAILFCLNIDDLISQLRRNRSGLMAIMYASSQSSTNKILNAYASVRFILIRCTPSQGPRTRNITKVYVNSKYNILFTCFLVFFHSWSSNPKKPTPKNQRLTKRNKVTSLFRCLNLF